MEKPKLVKRGIYRKVAQKRSPNTTIKTRLQSVQEKIGQLKEIKPAEKFLHEEDLRRRLRKSMLVRAVQNAEKDIISSTPHHTKNQINQPFFGNNFSVLLSPISIGRRSNDEKNELIYGEEDHVHHVQNSVFQKSSDSNSSEIVLTKEKISSKVNSPGNHNSSVIYVDTDNNQVQQELKISLRKSKRNQSTNRSKFENSIHNESKKVPKKLNTDMSFGSHEIPCVKETKRTPENILCQSPVKLPSAQQAAIKKSRIPLRTASQEHERAVEVNSSLSKQAKPRTRSKSGTPKKSKSSTHNLNTSEENKTSRSKSRKRRSISAKELDNSPNNDMENNVTVEQHTEINLNTLNKKNETCLSKGTPDKTKCTQDQEVDTATGMQFNKNTPKKQICEIRAANGKDQMQSLEGSEKDNASELQVILSKSLNSISTSSENLKKDNQSVQFLNDKVVHNITEIVNKTPRRPNNDTLELREPYDQVLDKNDNIPVILTEACSPPEKEDFINKSRPSAVRCKPADKSGGLSEVCTRSIALSPIIMGENKRQTTEILQQTRFEKSVQCAVEKCLNNSRRHVRSSKKSLDEHVARLKRSKTVEETEDDNTNSINNLITEISAKVNARTLDGNHLTVNRGIQTSMSNSFRHGSEQLNKTKSKKSFFSRFTEQMTQTSVGRPNSFTRGFYTNVSETASSSGAGSDLIDRASDFDTRYSHIRHNIFESLEEGNELDALDFSESDNPESSVLFNQTKPNHPWRFVNEGLLSEKSSSLNLSFIPTENQISARQSDSRVLQFIQSLQNSEGPSCGSNDDSGHSSSSPKNNTLRYCNTSTDTFSKGLPETCPLNRDATLSRTGRRQYSKKSHKMVEKRVDHSRETHSSPRKSLRAAKISNNRKMALEDGTSSSTNNKGQQNRTVISSKSSPGQKSFRSKALKRPTKSNTKSNTRSLKSARPLSTDNTVLSVSSADQQLLGVKPLSHLASKETENLESQHSSTDINGGNTTREGTSYSDKNEDSPGMETVANIEEVQNIPEIPDMDSESCSQENAARVSQASATENNIDELPPLQPSSTTGRTKRTKNNKKRDIKNDPIKAREVAAVIDEINILPSVGQGRPQRNRRPVRFLTDIIIDDDIKIVRKKATKKRLDDESTDNRKKSKKSKRSESVPKKKGRSADRKSKTKTSHKRVTTKKIDVPIENTVDNNDNIQNDISQIPGTSQESAQEMVFRNEAPDNYLGENPSHDTQLDLPNMEKESMPPLKGVDIINSTTRTRTRRNINGDSGFETIDNTNKKKLRNKGTKGRKKKNAQDAEDHVGIANAENDEKPGESKLLEGSSAPTPEPFVQPKHADHNPNSCSPNRVSLTERSLNNIKVGGVTKSHKRHNVAKDVADKVSRALNKLSDSSSVHRDLERSVGSSEDNHGLTIDESKSCRESLDFTNNDYVNYMMDGELYSLRYVNRIPSNTEYKKLGNLDITQTVKYPADSFSAGYIRLQSGVRKRPTITTKYSFIYGVVSGRAWVQCHNRMGTVQQGDFFVIPVGMEYSIQNIDPQSHLVLSYTKIRTGSS